MDRRDQRLDPRRHPRRRRHQRRARLGRTARPHHGRDPPRRPLGQAGPRSAAWRHPGGQLGAQREHRLRLLDRPVEPHLRHPSVESPQRPDRLHRVGPRRSRRGRSVVERPGSGRVRHLPWSSPPPRMGAPHEKRLDRRLPRRTGRLPERERAPIRLHPRRRDRRREVLPGREQQPRRHVRHDLYRQHRVGLPHRRRRPAYRPRGGARSLRRADPGRDRVGRPRDRRPGLAAQRRHAGARRPGRPLHRRRSPDAARRGRRLRAAGRGHRTPRCPPRCAPTG